MSSTDRENIEITKIVFGVHNQGLRDAEIETKAETVARIALGLTDE